jgi:hypothetical protein
LCYGWIVGFTLVDSTVSKTQIDLVVGGGNYAQVIRDDNGSELRRFDYTFFDGGISLQRNFGYGIFIARVGELNATRQWPNLSHTEDARTDALEYLSYSTLYMGVGVGVNMPFFGLVAGVLYFDRVQNDLMEIDNSHFQYMGSLRLGYED